MVRQGSHLQPDDRPVEVNLDADDDDNGNCEGQDAGAGHAQTEDLNSHGIGWQIVSDVIGCGTDLRFS